VIVIPAIDLKDGVCVRLKKGVMEDATVFNTDPAAQARTFKAQGFQWLHCVDLNGAFAGHSAEDASPDMGDSAITETGGLGGFAMAAAPAIVQFVGGSPEDAIAYSRRMYEVTIGESEGYTLPMLNFRGTPTGVDIRMVVETGILPQINTGIASRRAGIGQIGAGLVNPPMECFSGAVRALAAAV